MQIITIDFETYYDRDYSLSKMTTEEYIRDSRFEVIGVGVKIGNSPAVWYSGTDVRGFLLSISYEDKAILCHNTVFDGAILSWKYGIKPMMWFDTMSMARPGYASTTGVSLKNLANRYNLGAKGTAVHNFIGYRRKHFTAAELVTYGDYCIQDAELTYKLFRKLAKGFPPSELQVIDQTVRMYTEPVIELDTASLQQHLSEEIQRKQDVLSKLGGTPDKAKKMLMSNVRFAGLISALGVTPPLKISPATGKEAFAFAKTDPGMRDLLTHHNPMVRTLAEARLGTKSTIEETRTNRLIDVSLRGPLPIMLNYYGAHTGRYSGGEKLNLQNLPSRGNNRIRRSLRAPKGYKLVACDSSQIEARILAYLAGQKNLVQAFKEGRDVYREFASIAYRKNISDIVDLERFVGKTCILGLGYGMGKDKLRDTLGNAAVFMSDPECQQLVNTYRSVYSYIKKLWHDADGVLYNMVNGQSGVLGNILPYDKDGIHLPNGMRLSYTALEGYSDNTGSGYRYIANAREYNKHIANTVSGTQNAKVGWVNIYGGKVIENVVQALARIVVVAQALEIGSRYKLAFQVHDENVVCVPEAQEEEAKRFMIEVMSKAPVWAPDLPVACEAAGGDNYGDCK